MLHIKRLFGQILLFTVIIAGFFIPSQAKAVDRLFSVNPGIKLTYTFDEGVTWGFEISFTWMPIEWNDIKEEPYGMGFAFNVDSNFDGLTKMRLGYEFMAPFIGIEAGPSVIWRDGKTHFGLGFSFWAGILIIPTYTYTNVFNSTKNIHEVGTYFKLPLFGQMFDGDYSGGGGGGGDDD
jgi:hypothetical protein